MTRNRWILLEYPSWLGGEPAADVQPVAPSCPIWVPDANAVDICVYCGRSSTDHDAAA